MVIRSIFVEQAMPAVAKKYTSRQTQSQSFLDAVYTTMQKQVDNTSSSSVLLKETTTDERVQTICAKFTTGKALTANEAMYLRLHAPDKMVEVEKTMRERRMMEMAMRMASTKSDVDMTVVRLSSAISKSSMSSAEKESMMNHLKDVQKQYEKTKEYEQKPNSPLDDYTSKRIGKRRSYAEVLRAYRN